MPFGTKTGARRLVDFETFGDAAGAYAFIDSVLEASTEYSIIATDREGVIVLWNEGARRLHGYEADEIIGHPESELHAEDDVRARLPAAIMAHASEHGLWEGTAERARKDGTTFTARVVMTLRHGAEGEPIGFLLMSSDITDEINRQQELERSRRLVEAKAAQLAISLRYKSEFFSNMSHELRTPLNSLLILAELLRDNPEHNLTPKQVQYANVIHSSGADLLRLLSGILDLAKVGSGTVTPEIREVALAEIQHALREEFDRVADQNGVSFTVELADDLPRHIGTDATLVHDVLRNLLANAFKFTKHGAVEVHIGCADRGWSATDEVLARASTVIAFRISDTGIGMTAEIQRRIFDDFVQGDGGTARHYGGAGLGLSIASRLVRLLGGEITVTSSPGHGSTFTVYLPVGELRAARSAPHAGDGALRLPVDAAQGGFTALVVDDDARSIFALTALLERAHCKVVSANSGEAGLAFLERMDDIDVVLVDIMMPVMNGYETIGAMRRLPSRADLPILAVTAKAEAGERRRCIDAGASAYMSKPVDTADLITALRELIPAHPLNVH
jgi:PAS domain S-box-containing protein